MVRLFLQRRAAILSPVISVAKVVLADAVMCKVCSISCANPIVLAAIARSVTITHDVCYCRIMPSTNEEARLELERMRKERDLTMAWVARRIGKNLMWVRRKLNGEVFMKIDEYTLLKDAICSVAPRETLFK